ncbi:16S rRNA (guanine(966)-N(2))-methyltransferase RsmD [Chitinimonas lacunae]|uniref:16S rRNA (Guanine(966)-N(2))-methyltransferase RsmD n=1 Tax=Chitinimonas lacunae TaxID=1963018 RepID=A0ABV8MUZ9_9NEIS
MKNAPPRTAKSGKSKPDAHRNQVRIIAGEFRRRLLSFPDGEGLRPTPDRVRETLFNWLGQELHGLECLDLFAGSGALAFEAASRGARRVVAVENNRQAIAALQENRRLLDARQIDIVGRDALSFLASDRQQFDLIFLDPPFASDLAARVLPQMRDRLQPGGRVYLECAAFPPLDGWEIVRQGQAGLVHYAVLQAAATTEPA